MTTALFLFDIIQITGSDSFKFLQGQITADLNNLEQSDSILSAYCNRQGQVISVFYIFKNSDNKEGYTIITLGNTGSLLLNKIKKFSVFSKIEFNLITQPTDILNQYHINQNIDYYIEHLIPVITPQTAEQYLPNELNLIVLKAVSFKKGCFLGQEIIARVYYKSKPKKNIYKICLNTGNDLASTNEALNLQSGSSIKNVTNDNAGEILIANYPCVLAIIKDRHTNEALYINDIKCHI